MSLSILCATSPLNGYRIVNIVIYLLYLLSSVSGQVERILGIQQNVLLHKNILTIPPASTCGAPGAENEFILESKFEFGMASSLFQPGQVNHCAFDCARTFPQNDHCVAIVGQVAVTLGGSDCDADDVDTDDVACYLDVVVPSSTESTYSLWVKLPPMFSGPILDTGSFSLAVVEPQSADDEATLLLHVTPYRNLIGKLPLPVTDDWLHIAVQEDLTQVPSSGEAIYTVTVGGQPSTFYASDLARTRPTTGERARINAAINGRTSFPVAAQYKDLRRYARVFTNREVTWLRTGELPVVSPRSDCLCDGHHPLVDISKSTVHCWSNGAATSRSRRLVATNSSWLFVLPEFAVDHTNHYHYDLPLMWVSAPARDPVSLEVNSTGITQVESVSLQLVSAPPEDSIMFERLRNNTWLPWHYLAFDCSSLGYHSAPSPTGLYINDAYGAACQDVTDMWEKSWRGDFGGMSHPPVITWDVLAGRPGQVQPADSLQPVWMDERLTDFTRTEGVRVTFRGVARGAGPDPRQHVHAVVELEAVGRLETGVALPSDCPCFPGAECVGGETCDCPLDLGPGAGPQCSPFISSVAPAYGPMSGGTRIVLIGGLLQSDGAPMVYINRINCPVTEYNASHIVCITGPSTAASGPWPVSVQLWMQAAEAAQFEFRTEPVFTYKTDPVVTKIYPLKTTIRGGLYLTVLGFSMDSVSSPYLDVIMHYRNKEMPQDRTLCQVVGTTRLRCPTPHIKLPPEYEDLDVTYSSYRHLTTQRSPKKTSTEPSNRGKRYVNEHQSSVLERERRQVSIDGTHANSYRDDASNNVLVQTVFVSDSGIISQSDLQFTLSLILDGVMKWQDLAKNLPEYSQLAVYVNPIINPFTHIPQIFDPSLFDYLVITGEHMDDACDIDDYEVHIGSEECDVITLESDAITCRPPPDAPPPSDRPNMTLQDATWHASAVIVRAGNIARHVGYLQYGTAPPPTDSSVRNGIIAGVLLVLLIIAVIVVIICWWKVVRRRKSKTLKVPDPGEELVLMNDVRSSILDNLEAELQSDIMACLLDRTHLDIIKEIGKGHFGRVFAGILRSSDEGSHPQLVAIKTLKEEAFERQAITEFLKEATIMKDFDHENILRLVGVVIENRAVYVVLPFMENGDLRTFIAKADQMLTVRELLGFALQAARGMAYLERHKFVHRDVAARNCMVDADRVIKVADFGLARDMYEKDYYRPEDANRPIPVKWTALECLDGAEYTTKSDVWSYGVLVWEILTRGRRPYNDINNFDMKRYLLMGRRLETPEFCPSKIYECMLQCWHPEPAHRPSFSHITQLLSDVIQPKPAPPQASPTGESLRPCSRLSATPMVASQISRVSYDDSIDEEDEEEETPVEAFDGMRHPDRSSGYTPPPTRSQKKPAPSRAKVDNNNRVTPPPHVTSSCDEVTNGYDPLPDDVPNGYDPLPSCLTASTDSVPQSLAPPVPFTAYK